MKPKWRDEVAEILEDGRFAAWFKDLQSARRQMKRARQRQEELRTQINLLNFRAELHQGNAIDTLEDANALIDAGIILDNETHELDNASLEAVSQFEMQREKCSDLWSKIGALEVQADIAEEQGRGEEAKKLRSQREMRVPEYERENQDKHKLWREVEELWQLWIDRHMTRSEKKYRAKISRREAESLLEEQAQTLDQVSTLEEQLAKVRSDGQKREEALAQVFEEAGKEFECMVNEDFLHWTARENNKMVYVVPLLVDDENYVIPIKTGVLYVADAREGVDGLRLESEEKSEESSGQSQSSADSNEDEG